jgi:hypothetical protein
VYEDLIKSLDKSCLEKEAEIAKKQAILNRLNGHVAVVNGLLANKWIDVIEGDSVDAPAVPFRLLGRFPMKRGKSLINSLLHWFLPFPFTSAIYCLKRFFNCIYN